MKVPGIESMNCRHPRKCLRPSPVCCRLPLPLLAKIYLEAAQTFMHIMTPGAWLCMLTVLFFWTECTCFVISENALNLHSASDSPLPFHLRPVCLAMLQTQTTLSSPEMIELRVYLTYSTVRLLRALYSLIHSCFSSVYLSTNSYRVN